MSFLALEPYSADADYRKSYPGLDEIDYQEVMNPWIAKLYFSVFEKLPLNRTDMGTIITGNSVIMLTFARFKKDIIESILWPLLNEINVNTKDHYYIWGQKQPSKVMSYTRYEDAINHLMREMAVQIEDTYDHVIINNIKIALVSLVKEKIEIYNKSITKTAKLWKKIKDITKGIIK